MADYSLVLVHNPYCQALQDFEKIAAIVRSTAPDIEVFIVGHDHIGSVTRKQAARHPSFIFSPGELSVFSPRRGHVAAGRPIPKLEQMRMMQSAGVSTPDFTEWTEDGVIDEARFGPVVIVKSGAPFTSHGQNVFLVKTRAIATLAASQGAAWRAGAPWIVQQFIMPVDGRAHNYRVLNLLGENLFSICKRSHQANGPVSDYDDLMTGYVHHAVARLSRVETTFADDEDVLETARSVEKAFGDIPLRGCDIVRDGATGRCFVLEVNPGGNTWVFSKPEACERMRRQLGVDDLAARFNSFERAAQALIRATRARAV
ncbi:MAG: hypothetical protein JWN07_1482 [Hyphomicrobiales bacterium]|nr:hypothetical protein [Hyphomicrobiales bacterium]